MCALLCEEQRVLRVLLEVRRSQPFWVLEPAAEPRLPRLQKQQVCERCACMTPWWHCFCLDLTGALSRLLALPCAVT